ncbi:MAG TPA: aldehyde dehydrogenase (NADP(+)) [Opitutaceae bacterium]|jgi:NADP-dependent aldehyde dehydrogenase
MNIHGKSIIAGRVVEAQGPEFRAFDPAAGAPLGPAFHEASAGQVDDALGAAASACASYRAAPPEARAGFLEAAATEIESLGDALLERCRMETGLPLGRLQGERARTCAQLRLFAALAREGSWVDARIDRALPDRRPQPRPDLRRMLQPLGPVAVFGASNFPLAFSVAGGDTASALAAGCPVVAKAHPAHPGTSELVGGALTRAAASQGLPPGVFSLLNGGAAVGRAIVVHPLLSAVGFTGSRAAGRALFEAACARPEPIPVFAEMSSVNPLLILPGALSERGAAIAEGLAASVTLGSGQFCTKPGLIFVQKGDGTDGFLARLAGALAAQPPAPMLTPGIAGAFRAGRERAMALGGVRALPGSGPEASAVAVSAADFLRTPEMAAEVFGPFALVVIADSPEQVAACLRSLEGQLTATLHAAPSDLGGATPLLAEIERKAGRLVMNGFPTGVEVCPAMHHGGPYPATTDARFTSVGTAAILRFARPICYQGFPAELLPEALRDGNPRGLLRLVDGKPTREPIG